MHLERTAGYDMEAWTRRNNPKPKQLICSSCKRPAVVLIKMGVDLVVSECCRAELEAR